MSTKDQRSGAVGTLPTSVDLVVLGSGVAGLTVSYHETQENAENKKLFTRLWVHEALRGVYDRMVTEEQRDGIFSEVQSVNSLPTWTFGILIFCFQDSYVREVGLQGKLRFGL